MGFLNFIRNFRGSANHVLDNQVDVNVPLDFMAWTGRGCEPGFCVDLTCATGIAEAYERCSTLKTVVNRCAMAMANGKMWIVDENDNDVSNKYKNISRLFSKPNPLQTWTEFEMQFDVYRQLYGHVYIYAAVPVGFSNQDASALWVISPRYIRPQLSGNLYMQSSIENIVEKYILNIDGHEEVLKREHVLHIKDVNQNLNFCQHNISGHSRLSGLEYSIKNIIQAEEALFSLNKDRGAFGILSNDTTDVTGHIPMRDEEKKAILSHYQNTYGMSERAFKIMITDAKMKWQQMTFNVKDLMLFEGIDKNIQLIAAAFNYPYELLGLTSTSTFNSNSGKFNSESKKMLYQDNTIPIAKIYSEKLTDFFQLEKDKIIKDFSEVESLQTAENEAAETLSKKTNALHTLYTDGAITLEEYRLAIGYDEKMHGKTISSNE